MKIKLIKYTRFKSIAYNMYDDDVETMKSVISCCTQWDEVNQEQYQLLEEWVVYKNALNVNNGSNERYVLFVHDEELDQKISEIIEVKKQEMLKQKEKERTKAERQAKRIERQKKKTLLEKQALLKQLQKELSNENS